MADYLPQDSSAASGRRRNLIRVQGLLLGASLCLLAVGTWSPVERANLRPLATAACVILGLVALLGCRPFLVSGAVTPAERALTGRKALLAMPLSLVNVLFPSLLALLLISVIVPPGCTREVWLGSPSAGTARPGLGSAMSLIPVINRARAIVAAGSAPVGGWSPDSPEARQRIADGVLEALAKPKGINNPVRGSHLPVWVEDAIDLAVLQAAPYRWKVSSLHHPTAPWPPSFFPLIKDRLGSGPFAASRGLAGGDRVQLESFAAAALPGGGGEDLRFEGGFGVEIDDKKSVQATLLFQRPSSPTKKIPATIQGSPSIPIDVPANTKAYFHTVTLSKSQYRNTAAADEKEVTLTPGGKNKVRVLGKVALKDAAKLQDLATAGWFETLTEKKGELAKTLGLPTFSTSGSADPLQLTVCTQWASTGDLCYLVIAPEKDVDFVLDRLASETKTSLNEPHPGVLDSNNVLNGSVGPVRQNINPDSSLDNPSAGFLISDLRTETLQYGGYRSAYPIAAGPVTSFQLVPVIRNEMIFDGFQWSDATVRFLDGLPFCGRFSALRSSDGTWVQAYVILAPASPGNPRIESSQARGLFTLSLLLARQLFFEQKIAELGVGRLFTQSDALPVFVLRQGDLIRISEDTVRYSLNGIFATIALYFAFVVWMGKINQSN